VLWADQLDPLGLSQGDLVEDIVFANVAELMVVHRSTISKSKPAWLPQEQWKGDAQGMCHVIAKARKAPGLVLSHSCEIDKPHRKIRVFMAPVVSIDSITDESLRASIMEQKREAFFPLAGVPGRGDFYADLRWAKY